MITNENELASVQQQIADLHARLQALFNRTDLSHFEVHITASGYDRMIERLQREVDEYESLNATSAVTRP